MTDGAGDDHKDPMGVKRRWGRRELVMLAVAAVILVVGLLVTRRMNPSAPAAGVPAGGLPFGTHPAPTVGDAPPAR